MNRLQRAVRDHLNGQMTYGELIDWAIAHNYSLAHLDYVLDLASKETNKEPTK